MKFVLLLVFFSMIGASLLFYFSKKLEHYQVIESTPETKQIEISEDLPEEEVIKAKVAPKIEPKSLEKKAMKIYKEIAMLEEENIIEKKKLEKVVNLKEVPHKNNAPKTYTQVKKSTYQPIENSDVLLSSSLGDFYIQENLMAVSPSKYTKSMGGIQVKGQGYYFVETKKGNSNFPILIKKKKRSTYAVLTGLITIKTNNPNIANRIRDKYQLKTVQQFKHLNLYIYKTSSTAGLINMFTQIKAEAGIEKAELEILDKRLKQL